MARSALRYQLQINGCTKAVGNASRIAEVLSAWSGVSLRSAQHACRVGVNTVRVLRYLAYAYAKQNPDLSVQVSDVCEAQALMDTEAIRVQQDIRPAPVSLENKIPLYTLDVDDTNPDCIQEGATLMRMPFTTFEALAAELNTKVYHQSDFEVTGFKHGTFSDCWIKTKAVGDYCNGLFVNDIECIVTPPGRHPGLPGFYWIDPKEPVLIPVLKSKDIERKGINYV